MLRGMPENSVDSIVTDPPYGLAFMGKRWDYDVPSVEVWAECLRVLKPGGHLLAFAGTRTQHRMAVRIEDAGFEIRDMIAWVYGSGFPKSLDVSKAIDKAAGAEREIVGLKRYGEGQTYGERAASGRSSGIAGDTVARAPDYETAPATEAAAQWQGWGTALKPALEPITVARKPLAGTVAANVLEWGTGALNIDGCRVATGDKLGGGATSGHTAAHEGYRRPWMDNRDHLARHAEKCAANVIKAEALGRWPANLIHDGSDEVVAWFPANRPGGTSNGVAEINVDGKGVTPLRRGSLVSRNDTGSAARFFYCAKASKKDRNEGCEDIEPKIPGHDFGTKLGGPRSERVHTATQNHHPTVKPSDLMAYLCRLVTPPGGIVLDPFMGSGSTGKAAMREGFDFIGIEKDAGYFAIAKARIEYAKSEKDSGLERMQSYGAGSFDTVDMFD